MPSSRPTETEISDYLQTAFRSGAGALVAAPGNGFKIIVYGFAVVASAASVVKFQSAANDRTAAFSLGANGGMVVGPSEFALFECADNEALNLASTAGSDAQVWYMKARV